MGKKQNIFSWVIFAVLCVAIGWFGHQYMGDIVKWIGAGVSRPAAETASLKKADEGEFCAQVITPARNPETGDIREFPTTCSVPEGWELIENDIPELNLNLE